MMKRFKENYMLSENFSLYEYMEGASMPAKGVEMAWAAFTDTHEKLIQEFILELENIGSWINENYKSQNNNKAIGIRITAGFRPVEWEKLKGRPGTSQHTKVAVDFDLTKCKSIEFEVEVLEKTHEYLDKIWQGGLGRKLPTIVKNKITKSGFIHIDPRKKKTRFNY